MNWPGKAGSLRENPVGYKYWGWSCVGWKKMGFTYICVCTVQKVRISALCAMISVRGLAAGQVEVCVQNQKIDHLIRSIDSMFSMWPAGRTGAAVDRLLYNGNMLYRKDMILEEKREPESGEKFRIYDSQGQFCAVYVYDGRHRMFKNEKMFV